MPLTSHFLLLGFLLCSSSSISCFANLWDHCQSFKQCGEFYFGYPFGGLKSGCGVPDFQLDCVSDVYPVLHISGEDYRILEPSFLDNNTENHLITIVNSKHSLDTCTGRPGNYTQRWWYGPSFDMASELYTNLTFWRDRDSEFQNRAKLETVNFSQCDWQYSFVPDIDSIGTQFCKMHFQLPVKKDRAHLLNPMEYSIEIIFHIDPSRNLGCRACKKSNGICGYNPDNSISFRCYCRDGTYYPDKCPSHGGRNKAAITIGCWIGIAIIAVVMFFMMYAWQTEQPPARQRKQPPLPRSSTSRVEKFLKEYAYEMPTRYSQSDLKRMTNNFKEKLGEGGYGVVYKGKLRNGALVAVKLLDWHRHSESTQFMNEVATIGRVHHVNLVRLLGYCFESFTSALVYEYMVNGSLEKFIFARKKKGQILSWEQLYSIALGAARGIAYLHQDCDKRIIHFDIKPHNILLDSEFTPKVSDFGLAKFCGKGDDHISVTGARGTPGYVAPELCDRELGPVTDKSDVYSFGMLLLEIVGGRKNINVKASRSSQLYFPEWAFKLLESGELETRLRVRGGGEMEVEDEEKARRLTKVGLWCIQYKSKDRPCMSRVFQMLKGNGDDVSSPPLPFNSSSADPEIPSLSLCSSVTSSFIEIRL